MNDKEKLAITKKALKRIIKLSEEYISPLENEFHDIAKTAIERTQATKKLL